MLDMTVEELREMPKTTIRCNVTAPQALICFMESTDYESAIRNAVYTKGDTDTIAAIAGSIAEAFYGVRSIPQIMIDEAKQRLTPEMIELVNQFYLTIGEFDENYKGFQI
jgi:ADP-ribosylglycohydrolase